MRRPQTTRRADAFDDALRGLPVDDARLARESAELVRVVEAVLRAEHPEPDADFVADLRRRVMDDAGSVLTAEPARRVVRVRAGDRRAASRARRRRAGALAAAFVVGAGSFGIVGASAQALPGEGLYPVKRGIERVELGLQRGPTGTGRKQLELATERLAEVEALAGDGVDRRERALVADALGDFTTRARAGSDDLLRAYAVHGTTSGVSDVDAFAGQSGRTLQRLRDVLPVADASVLDGAASTVTGIAASAARACDACATAETERILERLDALAPAAPAPAEPSSAGPDDPAPAPSDPSSAAPGPTAGPTASAPSSAPGPAAEPTRVPDVREPVRSVTDPLLEGLLGKPRPSTASPSPGAEPTQDGLVPGLLDGLLGSP